MKNRLKPEIAKRVCELLKVTEGQFQAATKELALIPRHGLDGKLVFDSGYLLTVTTDDGREVSVLFDRDAFDFEGDEE